MKTREPPARSTGELKRRAAPTPRRVQPSEEPQVAPEPLAHLSAASVRALANAPGDSGPPARPGDIPRPELQPAPSWLSVELRDPSARTWAEERIAGFARRLGPPTGHLRIGEGPTPLASTGRITLPGPLVGSSSTHALRVLAHEYVHALQFGLAGTASRAAVEREAERVGVGLARGEPVRRPVQSARGAASWGYTPWLLEEEAFLEPIPVVLDPLRFRGVFTGLRVQSIDGKYPTSPAQRIAALVKAMVAEYDPETAGLVYEEFGPKVYYQGTDPFVMQAQYVADLVSTIEAHGGTVVRPSPEVLRDLRTLTGLSELPFTVTSKAVEIASHHVPGADPRAVTLLLFPFVTPEALSHLAAVDPGEAELAANPTLNAETRAKSLASILDVVFRAAYVVEKARRSSLRPARFDAVFGHGRDFDRYIDLALYLRPLRPEVIRYLQSDAAVLILEGWLALTDRPEEKAERSLVEEIHALLHPSVPGVDGGSRAEESVLEPRVREAAERLARVDAVELAIIYQAYLEAHKECLVEALRYDVASEPTRSVVWTLASVADLPGRFRALLLFGRHAEARALYAAKPPEEQSSISAAYEARYGEGLVLPDTTPKLEEDVPLDQRWSPEESREIPPQLVDAVSAAVSGDPELAGFMVENLNPTQKRAFYQWAVGDTGDAWWLYVRVGEDTYPILIGRLMPALAAEQRLVLAEPLGADSVIATLDAMGTVPPTPTVKAIVARLPADPAFEEGLRLDPESGADLFLAWLDAKGVTKDMDETVAQISRLDFAQRKDLWSNHRDRLLLGLSKFDAILRLEDLCTKDVPVAAEAAPEPEAALPSLADLRRSIDAQDFLSAYANIEIQPQSLRSTRDDVLEWIRTLWSDPVERRLLQLAWTRPDDRADPAETAQLLALGLGEAARAPDLEILVMALERTDPSRLALYRRGFVLEAVKRADVDPSDAEAARAWEALSARIRKAFDGTLPDRALLVIAAFGPGSGQTPEEVRAESVALATALMRNRIGTEPTHFTRADDAAQIMFEQLRALAQKPDLTEEEAAFATRLYDAGKRADEHAREENEEVRKTASAFAGLAFALGTVWFMGPAGLSLAGTVLEVGGFESAIAAGVFTDLTAAVGSAVGEVGTSIVIGGRAYSDERAARDAGRAFLVGAVVAAGAPFVNGLLRKGIVAAKDVTESATDALTKAGLTSPNALGRRILLEGNIAGALGALGGMAGGGFDAYQQRMTLDAAIAEALQQGLLGYALGFTLGAGIHTGVEIKGALGAAPLKKAWEEALANRAAKLGFTPDVVVVSEAEFRRITGRSDASAILHWGEAETPTLYVVGRPGDAAVLVEDEIAHLEKQLLDPEWNPRLTSHMGGVKNLADWRARPLAERRQVYIEQLEIEIHAKQQILAKPGLSEEAEAWAADELASLEERLALASGAEPEEMAALFDDFDALPGVYGTAPAGPALNTKSVKQAEELLNLELSATARPRFDRVRAALQSNGGGRLIRRIALLAEKEAAKTEAVLEQLETLLAQKPPSGFLLGLSYLENAEEIEAAIDATRVLLSRVRPVGLTQAGLEVLAKKAAARSVKLSFVVKVEAKMDPRVFQKLVEDSKTPWGLFERAFGQRLSDKAMWALVEKRIAGVAGELAAEEAVKGSGRAILKGQHTLNAGGRRTDVDYLIGRTGTPLEKATPLEVKAWTSKYWNEVLDAHRDFKFGVELKDEAADRALSFRKLLKQLEVGRQAQNTTPELGILDSIDQATRDRIILTLRQEQVPAKILDVSAAEYTAFRRKLLAGF